MVANKIILVTQSSMPPMEEFIEEIRPSLGKSLADKHGCKT